MTHTIKNYACLAMIAMSGLASAKTALIDFGRADATAASPYNAAVMITGLTGDVALIDTDSLATGWTVSVT